MIYAIRLKLDIGTVLGLTFLTFRILCDIQSINLP